MKTRVTLGWLALVLGVTADEPRRVVEDRQESIPILAAAREYRPEGSTTVRVEHDSARNTACVRYSVRKDGQDVVTTAVLLRKTAKGWQVESCSR